MPDHQQLIREFNGGDPIAGWDALCELLAQGDAAEESLFSQRVEQRTVQHQRRWLRYVAVRESSVRPRLLERLKGSPYGDSFPVSCLFSGLRESSDVTGELYGRIAAYIRNNQPGQANDTVMAYGQAGADLTSIFHLISKNSYAWEKLRTGTFRSARVSCARITTSSLATLRQLVTHSWKAGGLAELANVSGPTDSELAIDSAEISFDTSYQFMRWRRGEVADEVLRYFSEHNHQRVRLLGASILADLSLQRTARLISEWLKRENNDAVRGLLMDALQRTSIPFSADALLETYGQSKAVAAYLAKVGWLATDKSQAITILTEIAAGSSAYSADALVSLARLGSRHSSLDERLDSHDYYSRVNAMLALGYLKEVKCLPKITKMRTEAANAMERINAAAAAAMLGKSDAAVALHRELVDGAATPDYFERVDIYFVHRHLKDAVLAGLEAGGQDARPLLDAWRMEMEPLNPVQETAQPSPITGKAMQNEPIIASKNPDLGTSGPSQNPLSLPEAKNDPPNSEPDSTGKSDAPKDDKQNKNDSDEPAKKSDTDLLVWLTRIAGVGGLGLGIFYLLLKPLHIEALDGAAVKVFMLIVYGVAATALIVWAARDRKNNALAAILAVVVVVVGFFSWSIGNSYSHDGSYDLTVDVLKPDGTQARTNDATVTAFGKQVYSNQDGKSWTVRLGQEEKGHSISLAADIKGEGLHVTETFTPEQDHKPAVHLKLVPGGSVDFTVLVLDENGATAPDAIAFEVGGKSGVTDANGEATLSTTKPLGTAITLRARRGQDEVAMENDYRVGSSAATLTLKHLGKSAAAKVAQPATPAARSGSDREPAPAQKSSNGYPAASSPASSSPVGQAQNQQTNIVINNAPTLAPTPVANLKLRLDNVRLKDWFVAGPNGNQGAWPTSISFKVDDQVMTLQVSFLSLKNKPNQISMDSVSKIFELTKGKHTFGCTVQIDVLQNKFDKKHRTVTAAELEPFTLETDAEMNPFVTLNNTTITQCQLLRNSDEIPQRTF